MRTGLLFGSAMALLVSLPAFAIDPALQRAIDAPTRTAKFVARDGARHPGAELGFFGVTPHATVVEIWPGGGYWTQILAPLLHDHGTYYLAMGTPDGDQTEREFQLSPKFKAMLDANPALYDKVKFTMLGAHHAELAPPGSADLVLTFRNLHNWMEAGDTPQIIAPTPGRRRIRRRMTAMSARTTPSPWSRRPASSWSAAPRSTPTRATPRITRRASGRCRRPTRWARSTTRNTRRSARRTISC
jgi:hypothetical protein